CGCRKGVLPGAARRARAHLGSNRPTRLPCRLPRFEHRLLAALTVGGVNTSYELANARPVTTRHTRRNRGWFIRRLLAVADVEGGPPPCATARLRGAR